MNLFKQVFYNSIQYMYDLLYVKKLLGAKKKIKKNNSASVAQICGLMSQNPEPNKFLILYAVNTSNNHLCVFFLNIYPGMWIMW